MGEYQGVDYYNIDSVLSEEELMVREAVRQFVSEKVVPVIGRCMEEARFPRELVPEIASLGMLGPNIPVGDDPVLNNVAYGLVMQELERGDSGLRSFASVTGALVMYPIYEYGSPEQKDYWLPLLKSGEKIGCFGLTEPDYGSDPGGMVTRAVKKGSSWVLNGAKMWITNGTISDVAVVWAKVDGEVWGFLVETDRPGFSAPEMKNKFSLRASVTSELILSDVEIPEENRLPKSKGLKSALKCLTQARYGIAWGAVGAAMSCYDEALGYARERIQFDKPIASFQLVQQKLVNMITEITKAQLMVLQLGRLKDRGKINHAQVSMAKRNNVAVALRIAREAVDILGANGITYEYQSGRHACNLESVETYEGTHDIHTLIIGSDITGIDAYS
ncbi:acyl-CoA dehydrogenase family protein [candidate division KSB1 bacterium]